MAKVLTLVLLLFALVVCTAPDTCAQTTEFTYQGSLNNGGTPANGNYDFEFALYDALSAGTQLGSTQARNGVAVANGFFSVSLDFGNQFPGANRFLEIRVRIAGGGAFTPLTPRQQVNSAPYTVKALNTDNAATATNAAQLGGIAANQYVLTGDPRMTDARNPLPNSSNYIQNTASQQSSSNFNISGNGVVGGTLGIGTNNPAGLLHVRGTNPVRILGDPLTLSGSESVDFFARSSTFSFDLGGMRIQRQPATGNIDTQFFAAASGNSASEKMRVTGDGNVGIGVLSPDFRLDVGGRMRVRSEASGSAGIWFNHLFLPGGRFDQAFVGMQDDTHVGLFGNTGGGWGLVMSTDNGSVGIGTVTPAARLAVRGDATDVLLGSAGCGAPTAAVGFGTMSGCTNFALGGNTNAGADAGTFLNRPAGRSLHFRENNGTDQMTIAPGGNVGIGITTPTELLDVNGSALIRGSVTMQGLTVNGIIASSLGGQVGGSQQVCRNTTNGFLVICASSLRYKTNVRTFAPGLDIVNRLHPISFTWKQDGSVDFGLGAEVVAEVEPLLTFTNDKGQVEGVKYDRIGVVLINAIKEQQAQIDTQNKTIVEQGRTIENLRSEMNALKQLVCSQNPSAVCRERK